jgi:M6 family metalloprotease-like protein
VNEEEAMTTRACLGVAASCLAGLFAASEAAATIAPRKGVKLPSSFVELKEAHPTAFTYSRALQPMMQRIQLNRSRIRSGAMTEAAAAAAGGTAITGSRSIPVLMATYHNTASQPYPVANLQKELFDGPWPTGTMTDFYREISYGRFTVTGTVFPWKQLSKDDTYYEDACNGLCAAGKIPEFLKETLDAADASVDFSKYDNDGPDGIPNSGDDDGYVDFVAFVQPESGGECGNSNIWSHRWSYSGWTGSDYTTKDPKAGGGFIKVNDYVIMPALACDGSTMIQIGVFAHEFGHAFGLPDLYDTDGGSEGLGNWCLMASGSWGGDGQSPERPSHMCAWAKKYLGWLTPTPVSGQVNGQLPDVERNAFAYEVPISSTQYYLITNRQKRNFDVNLPGPGLLIWRVNETVLNSGMANNTVNADENNQGVELQEADGRFDLDNEVNRGDAGDPFPGTANKRCFDNSTNPKSAGTVSVCQISDSVDNMTALISASSGTCAQCAGTRPNCSMVGPGTSDGGRWASWGLLSLPVLLAIVLTVVGMRRRPVAAS